MLKELPEGGEPKIFEPRGGKIEGGEWTFFILGREGTRPWMTLCFLHVRYQVAPPIHKKK